MSNFREVLHGGRFEVCLPSDMKRNGRAKYYRGQHLLSCRRSKQVRHEGKVKSDRMHDANIRRLSARDARRARKKQARAQFAAQRQAHVSTRIR